MERIVCIHCNKSYHKRNDTELLKAKQYEGDSEVRRLNCEKCGNKHMFTID